MFCRFSGWWPEKAWRDYRLSSVQLKVKIYSMTERVPDIRNRILLLSHQTFANDCSQKLSRSGMTGEFSLLQSIWAHKFFWILIATYGAQKTSVNFNVVRQLNNLRIIYFTSTWAMGYLSSTCRRKDTGRTKLDYPFLVSRKWVSRESVIFPSCVDLE